jgi:hypothetical protein
MAWRIHHSVKRGEIDNRQPGAVRGRLWLDGLPEPVLLELQGNACPDLAGCLLTFENPDETIPMRTEAALSPLQRGTIGDLTASRKVRVPDVPIEEFSALRQAGKPAPEHTANCLYLEWFSEANGRVVIESADYKLTLSAPVWTLSPEQEQRRRQEAADAFSAFLDKVSETLAAAQHEPPPDKEWDEFDYEKFMRESDARTDKYLELLDKYRDQPDREHIIAQEMGWAALDAETGAGDTHTPAAPPEGEGASDRDDDDWLDVDEINRMCAEAETNPPQPDPATEGIDWVREEDGGISHPLSLRAFDGSVALWHRCRELGLSKRDDPDLCDLISEFQVTGAKLAGALDSLAYGRDQTEGPFIVAYLKRALGHLHRAQAALEQVVPKNLLPERILGVTRKDLFDIREEILRLMEEFRRRT